MGAHITKRLLWLPVTVFLIVLITFYLSQSADQYILIDEISPELNSRVVHPRKIHQEYIQLTIEKELHLPTFYFSILPENLKSLHQIVDLRERKAKKGWLSSHDSELVEAHYRSIHEQMDTIDSAVGYNRLQALLYASPEDVQGVLDLFSDDELNKKKINQIKKSGSSWMVQFPNIVWHGWENKFHHFLSQLLQFNFGNSTVDGRPVWSKIYQALCWTVPISLIVLFLSILLSYLLSLITIATKYDWLQKMITAKVLILYAMPLFWIATLCIVFLTTEYYGNWLNVFPSVGIYSSGYEASWVDKIFSLGRFLLLPIFCMVASGLAFFFLQWKDNAEDIQARPFVITAKSKGLHHLKVLQRHIFSNAGYSILGLVGFFIPSLISGSIIIEVLFNIPGMGRLMFTSINLNDWNVVIAIVFIASFVSFIGFIVADLILQWIHPKNKILG